MATIHDFLKCPKCGKQMMGKSLPQRFDREYFSHCCHRYFGVNELVNQWGYDAADFGNTLSVKYLPIVCKHTNVEKFPPFVPEIFVRYHTCKDCGARIDFLPVVVDYPHTEVEPLEPDWETSYERVDAYEMVNRMLLGIPEWDDYFDLKETQEYALQTGVQ